jgi:saccharopine dehydrogenase-like NADP-dependent oxidoreductase
MSGRVEERAQTRLWRETLLIEAGFAPGLAVRLAADAEYDLHELLNLVDRGCPPHLAARILAPR